MEKKLAQCEFSEACPLGKQLLHFACLGQLPAHLMILLEDDFPGPLIAHWSS